MNHKRLAGTALLLGLGLNGVLSGTGDTGGIKQATKVMGSLVERVKPPLCVEVLEGHNNDEPTKKDVIFVGISSKKTLSRDRFYDYLDEIMTTWETITPLAGNKHLFNFWKIDVIRTVEDPGKKHGYGSDETVDDLAEICGKPNASVVTIYKADFSPNALGPSYKNLIPYQMNLSNLPAFYKSFKDVSVSECKSIVENCKVVKDFKYSGKCQAIDNLRDEQDPEYDQNMCTLLDQKLGRIRLSVPSSQIGNTLAHEAGHAWFDLYDEYVDKKEENKKEPLPFNCYATETKDKCMREAPWMKIFGEREGLGCYEGCAHANSANGKTLFRPTQYSTMGRGSYEFKIWNEFLICHDFIFWTGGIVLEGCERFIEHMK
jgi:hypothetical protein